MQAADGPNSSQREWHQIGVKTRASATRSKFGSEIRGKTTISGHPRLGAMAGVTQPWIV
jgi:hypothetical protein